ncbi:MAG: hypothetical protein CTY25_03595 [Methylobacterium sp.]|nr:MAG: hypothetical protein CTY25_03595 [Methylobacterium sp.]
MIRDSDVTGFIEACASGAGFIVVSGWAATKDNKRLEQLVLQIEGVGDLIVTDFCYRQDLAAAGIADGYAAFERTVRTTEGAPARPVIHAQMRNGSGLPLSSFGTRYVPFEPRGSIDWANDEEVAGWVYDPAVGIGLDGSACVRLNGRVEIPIDINLPRPDLMMDRGGGEQLFGFATPTTLVREERARQAGAATLVELVSSGKVLDRRSLPPLGKANPPPESGSKAEPAAKPATAPAKPGVAEKPEAAKSPSPAKPAARPATGDLQVKPEEIVVAGRVVLVSGWLSRKDQSALDEPVMLALPGAEPVTIAALDHRADLARKNIAGGLGGFHALFEFEGEPPALDTLDVMLDGASQSVSLKSCRRPAPSPGFTLALHEGRAITGSVFDLAALSGKASYAVEIGKASIPVELAEPRSGRRIWTKKGLLATDFSIGLAAICSAMRALGEPDGEPEKMFHAALKQGEKVLAKASGKLLLAHRGKLEDASGHRIKGWLAASPDTPAELDIYLDGTRYTTIKADRVRTDLVAKGIVKRGGGFQLDIVNPLGESREFSVAIHPAYQKRPISGSPQKLTLAASPREKANPYSTMLAARERSVSIIIPVYNAADDVEICLKSLCYWTTFPCRVIIIDDCSPDPRIQQILAPYKAYEGFEIYKNEVNLGFTKTVNRGIELAGDDDVVFLNSDTLLTPLWLQGLRAAAYSAPRIATVTPLSNNAGVFSVPEMNASNHIPDEIGIAGMARVVQQTSLLSYPRVPTGNGFCLYVRRSCIEEIGPLDAKAFPVGYGEENDFCMRALHAGFEHVMDDRTYVYHKRSASFGNSKSVHYANGRATLAERYPEYSRLTAVFTKSAEILGVRWRVRRAMAAKAKPLPRVLFVISTETGGTPQTNRDLMNALSGEFEPWLMRCNGSEIKLWKVEPGQDRLVEVIEFKEPIEPLIHRSQEYDAALFGLLSRHAFELVHARHLGWHGLGLQAVCKRLGLPFVLSLHDFYTVCPSIKLLDENNRYCGGKCTATPGECAVELWDRKSFPPLKNQFIRKWQASFATILQESDALVTTSGFAHKTFLDNYPKLAEQDFRVIPHGRNFSEFGMFGQAGKASEPLRVLVPGNISVAKGANLIASIAEMDQGKNVEFHILGDHGRLKEGPGIVVHGRYARDEFVARAVATKPHVGAVFSIWPETYCHTLTEMWAMGLPVIGMSIGAVGERIAAHGGGWLIAPEATPEEALAFVRNLRSKPKEIAAQIGKIKAWQDGYGRYYTTRYMAAMYHRLYADVMERHRKLRHPTAERRYTVIAEVGTSAGAPAIRPEAWQDQRENLVPWPLGSDIEALAQPEITPDLIRLGKVSRDEEARLRAIATRRRIPIVEEERPEVLAAK